MLLGQIICMFATIILVLLACYHQIGFAMTKSKDVLCTFAQSGLGGTWTRFDVWDQGRNSQYTLSGLPGNPTMFGLTGSLTNGNVTTIDTFHANFVGPFEKLNCDTGGVWHVSKKETVDRFDVNRTAMIMTIGESQKPKYYFRKN